MIHHTGIFEGLKQKMEPWKQWKAVPFFTGIYGVARQKFLETLKDLRAWCRSLWICRLGNCGINWFISNLVSYWRKLRNDNACWYFAFSDDSDSRAFRSRFGRFWDCMDWIMPRNQWNLRNQWNPWKASEIDCRTLDSKAFRPYTDFTSIRTWKVNKMRRLRSDMKT